MAEKPEGAHAVQAEGDSRMDEAAAAAEQPSAAQGGAAQAAAQVSAAQAAARSSAAPAAAQEPRRVPMEVGQAADPDVAMTVGAATRAETVEETREAKRLRFHETSG